MTGYQVERVRTTPNGNLTYELVLDDWSRATVTIPRRRATADLLDGIITRALARRVRPAKPFAP